MEQIAIEQTAIFIPMSAQAILTFAVLLLIPYKRFRAAFANKVTVDDFALGESAQVPGDVSLPNRNMINLLEIPVLFYVLCLALFSAGLVTPLFSLSWAYFALRFAHSIIHLSYNNVIHRLVFFGASNLVLIIMWGQFIRTLL